jgi:hypothetical protein
MMEWNSPQLLALAARAILGNVHRLSRGRSDILADVRLLRFHDAGTLSLIDRLLDGERPPEEEVQNILSDFNDHEWKVADAAARLMEEIGPVSNITREELQIISWRKPRVREDVKRHLNMYGQTGYRVDRAKLVELKASIDDLNNAIDEVEHLLVNGRAR